MSSLRLSFSLADWMDASSKVMDAWMFLLATWYFCEWKRIITALSAVCVYHHPFALGGQTSTTQPLTGHTITGTAKHQEKERTTVEQL